MGAEGDYRLVRGVFEFYRGHFVTIAAQWVDDPEAVVADASQRLDKMLPGLAYVNDPGHPFALSLFYTAVSLAMHLALRDRGIATHDFGRALLECQIANPIPEIDYASQLDKFKAAGDASLVHTEPGEFVFEVLTGSEDFDYGINVKSCGVCYLFSQHDAMDFVPYMCAGDDVLSDQADDGLRRTGTIGLGAHQCDFRYQKGGEPLQLWDQYPELIQIGSSRGDLAH